MSFILGMNCQLHFGDTEDALGELTLVDNVKDLTLNLSKATADATTRGNSGWRANVGTLRECQLEFQIQWEPGDAFFQALLDSFLADSLVQMAVLDGPTSSGTGIQANFSVTNFTRNEELEGVVTVDVTCELSEYIDWVDEGSGSETAITAGERLEQQIQQLQAKLEKQRQREKARAQQLADEARQAAKRSVDPAGTSASDGSKAA